MSLLQILFLSVIIPQSISALAPPPHFKVSYPDDSRSSHFKFGKDLGSKYPEEMKKRVAELFKFDNMDAFWKCDSDMADKVLDKLIKIHKNEPAFDNYFAELEGFAAGSGAKLRDIYLGTFEQEFRGIFMTEKGLHNDHPPRPDYRDWFLTRSRAEIDRINNDADIPPECKNITVSAEEHCSDYGSCSLFSNQFNDNDDKMPKSSSSTENPLFCANGHNEDNKAYNINRTALVDVKFGESGNHFIAFTYLGDLPTTAFGVNKYGVGLTMNWLGPDPIGYKFLETDEHALKDILSKKFHSRSLLDSKSYTDALALLAFQKQNIAGQNFQIIDYNWKKDKKVDNPRISSVEVGPLGSSALRNFNLKRSSFHTNHYVDLQPYVSSKNQTLQLNSLTRLERIAEIDHTYSEFSDNVQREEILMILGDQANSTYPIFHDETTDPHEPDHHSWTLTSAYFDSIKGTMEVLEGNPRNDKVVYRVEVNSVKNDGCNTEEFELDFKDLRENHKFQIDDGEHVLLYA